MILRSTYWPLKCKPFQDFVFHDREPEAGLLLATAIVLSFRCLLCITITPAGSPPPFNRWEKWASKIWWVACYIDPGLEPKASRSLFAELHTMSVNTKAKLPDKTWMDISNLSFFPRIHAWSLQFKVNKHLNHSSILLQYQGTWDNIILFRKPLCLSIQGSINHVYMEKFSRISSADLIILILMLLK